MRRAVGPVVTAVAAVIAAVAAVVPIDANRVALAQSPPNELVSVAAGGGPIGNGNSFAPSISGDGALVAFTSNPIYGAGAVLDTGLLRDRRAGTTALIPAAGNERSDPVVSRDGCFVVFHTFTEVFVRRRCENNQE